MNKLLPPFGVFVWVAMFVNSAGAYAQAADEAPADSPPSPPPSSIIFVPVAGYRASAWPGHVSIGNQQFDAGVAGLREYLETTRSTDPRLYAQLDPDLHRLESRTTVARIALITGLAAGAASTVYAILGGKDCALPSVFDPAYPTKAAAWDACNRDDMRTTTTFALLGVGSIIVGAAAWLAITPGRSDLFAFANKHNRLSREPLRFQVGYDPASRLAYGGATLTF